jgi:ribosomal protein S12 methylthiotransferase
VQEDVTRRAPVVMRSSSPSPARRVYFVSLGCAKNQVDTEVMLGVVEGEGHRLVDDPAGADTLVVNTCGFIEAAKEESIDAILELAEVKRRRGDGTRLVVAGCLSQRHSDELAAELPEVDHFLGSSDMLGLRAVLRGDAPRLGVSALSRRAWLYDHAAPRRTIGPRHTAFVKIAEGCDRPCAFCIIPRLRGPQRSRTAYSVVEEAHGLVAAGAREICLVAQDLTTYGNDLPERGLAPADLEGLLDALGEIDGLRWIRLHYAYPSAVTDGLVARIGGHPRVARYLDVPIQHIDGDVLKRMRRGYGERMVRTLVERVRAAPERIWLRTTLLVGHPGETPEAFARLRDFVAEGQLDHVGVFPWSREEGTAAALQPSRVDPALAEERAAELMAVQAQVRARTHRALVGTELEVLVDGESDESEFLLDARHQGQAPQVDGKVVVCDAKAGAGTFVRVRVLAANAHDLVGSADPTRSPGDEAEDLLGA